jgi:hypothetical protein
VQKEVVGETEKVKEEISTSEGEIGRGVIQWGVATTTWLIVRVSPGNSRSL